MGNRVKTEDDSRAQIFNPETPGRDEMNMSRMPAYTSTNVFSPSPRHMVSENTPKERPTTLRMEKCQEPREDPDYETFTLQCPTSRRASRHICHDFGK